MVPLAPRWSGILFMAIVVLFAVMMPSTRVADVGNMGVAWGDLVGVVSMGKWSREVSLDNDCCQEGPSL